MIDDIKTDLNKWINQIFHHNKFANEDLNKNQLEESHLRKNPQDKFKFEFAWLTSKHSRDKKRRTLKYLKVLMS